MERTPPTYTERLLQLTKKPPAPSQPYPDLSDADEYTERKQQAFAITHVTNAIAGLRLCRAEVATGYASDMLEEHIAILSDIVSDLQGWEDAISESVISARR